MMVIGARSSMLPGIPADLLDQVSEEQGKEIFERALLVEDSFKSDMRRSIRAFVKNKEEMEFAWSIVSDLTNSKAQSIFDIVQIFVKRLCTVAADSNPKNRLKGSFVRPSGHVDDAIFFEGLRNFSETFFGDLRQKHIAGLKTNVSGSPQHYTYLSQCIISYYHLLVEREPGGDIIPVYNPDTRPTEVERTGYLFAPHREYCTIDAERFDLSSYAVDLLPRVLRDRSALVMERDFCAANIFFHAAKTLKKVRLSWNRIVPVHRVVPFVVAAVQTVDVHAGNTLYLDLRPEHPTYNFVLVTMDSQTTGAAPLGERTFSVYFIRLTTTLTTPLTAGKTDEFRELLAEIAKTDAIFMRSWMSVFATTTSGAMHSGNTTFYEMVLHGNFDLGSEQKPQAQLIPSAVRSNVSLVSYALPEKALHESLRTFCTF